MYWLAIPVPANREFISANREFIRGNRELNPANRENDQGCVTGMPSAEISLAGKLRQLYGKIRSVRRPVSGRRRFLLLRCYCTAGTTRVTSGLSASDKLTQDSPASGSSLPGTC